MNPMTTIVLTAALFLSACGVGKVTTTEIASVATQHVPCPPRKVDLGCKAYEDKPFPATPRRLIEAYKISQHNEMCLWQESSTWERSWDKCQAEWAKE